MEKLSPESQHLIRQIISLLQEKEDMQLSLTNNKDNEERPTAQARQLNTFGPITQAEYYTQRLVQAATLTLRSHRAEKREKREKTFSR